jgi:hypothetical protein
MRKVGVDIEIMQNRNLEKIYDYEQNFQIVFIVMNDKDRREHSFFKCLGRSFFLS